MGTENDEQETITPERVYVDIWDDYVNPPELPLCKIEDPDCEACQ